LATRLLQLQPVTPDHIGTVASLPMAADVQAAALAAAAAKASAGAAKKSPVPQAVRGPAIAQRADTSDELARRVTEALADGRSHR
jgi:hypothetical protein